MSQYQTQKHFWLIYHMSYLRCVKLASGMVILPDMLYWSGPTNQLSLIGLKVG